MPGFKKPPKKEEASEEKKAPLPVEVGFCECGEPVAVELGQTNVCAKHIRAS